MKKEFNPETIEMLKRLKGELKPLLDRFAAHLLLGGIVIVAVGLYLLIDWLL